MAREIHDTLAQGLTAIALNIEGAMHRLETDPRAGKDAGVLGAIADGKNIVVIGPQILVNGDAIRNPKTGIAGEFDIGHHTDPHQHQVGWIPPAVA